MSHSFLRRLGERVVRDFAKNQRSVAPTRSFASSENKASHHVHHHYFEQQKRASDNWFPLMLMAFVSGCTASGLTLLGCYYYPSLLHKDRALDHLEETKWRAAWLPAAGIGAMGVAAAGVYSENSAKEPMPHDDLGNSSGPSGGPGLTPHFIADAASRAAPAVVNITVHHKRMEMQEFFGRRDNSSGSGFIFGEDGLILTNYHVVQAAISSRGGGDASVLVSLQDGRVFDAEVVNFDRASDLALLAINSDDPLPTVKLGNSGNLRVGEWVLALGSPLHLRNSVTAGIISCVDRKAKELGLTGSYGIDYIQTDAAINQGNSGGPLVNLWGEVIGVNNMKVLAADGVSFAIPVDTAKEVISQLLVSGRVLRPYLGIKMLPINPRVASQLRKLTPTFPEVSNGILVPEVTKGSPAEIGGLKAGDVIVGFGKFRDDDVTTGKLIEELAKHIGKSMELSVLRSTVDGREHLITLYVVASRVEE